jgi:hypothetical protein
VNLKSAFLVPSHCDSFAKKCSIFQATFRIPLKNIGRVVKHGEPSKESQHFYFSEDLRSFGFKLSGRLIAGDMGVLRARDIFYECGSRETL